MHYDVLRSAICTRKSRCTALRGRRGRAASSCRTSGGTPSYSLQLQVHTGPDANWRMLGELDRN